MTAMSPTQKDLLNIDAPAIRPDVEYRRYDDECVVWSPGGMSSVYLDAVDSLIFQMLDGSATVGEMARDVNEIMGIPAQIAEDRMQRVIRSLDEASVLVSSAAPPAREPDVEIFLGPENP